MTEQPIQIVQDSLNDSDTPRVKWPNVPMKKFLSFLLLVIFIITIPLTVYLLQKRESYDIRSRAQISSPFIPPDFTSLVSPSENRIDKDGDGVYESYWIKKIDSTLKVCQLFLHSLSDKSLIWTAHIPNCNGGYFEPIFHTRSFMGDTTRDFTVVVKGVKQPSDPDYDVDYHLYAGDGATGILRNFTLPNNAERAGTLRLRGIQIVDFKLASYPGPALLVRNNGGGNNQKGLLFYFPSGNQSYIELTKTPSVINSNLFQNYPFPGVDVPNDLYTSIYNSFNSSQPCQKITEVNQLKCGVPDRNTGQGIFMGKLAVADIDADGVDDALTTYMWRSVIWPGRPKGNIKNLGAPQYDNYYNPQDNGNPCHSGRHYGLSILTQVDSDPFLETIDIAGTPVDNFSDIVQNVSRNVALVDTSAHPTLSTIQRVLLWNKPMGTSKPDCESPKGNTKLYDNSIHHPSDGTLRDTTDKTLFVHYNRWTQTNKPSTCTQSDDACYTEMLKNQTGYWTWEVRKASDGSAAKSTSNMYVWDIIPEPSGNVWVVYSGNATIWNVGSTAITGGNDLYRDDVTIGYLTLSTLQLSRIQPINITAKPFLKLTPWQLTTRSTTSNRTANRLFTTPVSGSSMPGFVLKTPTGLSLFTYDGTRWFELAKYTTAGKIVSTSIAPTPTASQESTPIPTPQTSPIPTPTPAYSCPKNGLSHYWNLNDSSAFINDNVGSLSGLGYNITKTTGKLGSAKKFNGTTSYIDFSDVLPIDKTTAFSFAFWMNEPDRDEISHIIAKQDNLNVGQGYAIAIGKSDQLVFNIANDSHTENMIQVQGGVIRDGNWHMVVVTYDGSSSGKGVKLYVDGKLPTTSVTLDSLSQSPVATVPLRFGTRGHAGAKFGTYAGILDEVGYWNRVLTAQDVTALYNNGSGLTCP